MAELARPKTVVVMPALNAARTLKTTVAAIPRDWVDEIILVDDRSTDETLRIARELGVHVVWHPHNVGYGGNQKTCYLEALQRGAEIVVMLHPDGQYEPILIPKLIAPIAEGAADLVLGTRMAERGAARAAGMPLYKRVANRALTTVENGVLGTQLTDLHTGYRAYSRDLLLTVPFLRNSIDFVFDSELLMQASYFGFRIAEVPARTRYFAEASSVGPWVSTVYGVKTLWAAGRLIMHRTQGAAIAQVQSVTAAARASISRVSGARPATLLFCAAVALSGGVLLNFLSDLTFWRDEWAFILYRRGSGIDTYLDPFVEQLLALPVASYKLLIALFGIESPTPFQIASTLVFLASVVVMWVYVRRRVGEWLALAAALPVLFLGPAWDDLLFPFQISFFGSVACGIGALLALEREDRKGDVIATALLAIGLFCSHVGIPFVVAATVDLALTRERFRRAFVVVIPTALWMIWYLGWGREAQNFVSFHNFSTLPGYVGDGFSSSLSTLLGLAVPRDETTITPLDWGRPLLVLAIAGFVWRVWRVGWRSFSRRLWAVLTMGLLFWSLTGLNASFFGQATSGRYQYMGVVFIILIAAELFRGVRVRTWVAGTVLAVSLLATLANFSSLRDNANGLAGIALKEKGGLAALELTRGVVPADFELTEDNAGVDYLGAVHAAPYFSAIDAYGSPAYTPAELAGADEQARVAADMVFAAALGVKPTPAEGDAAGVGPCTEVTVGPEPQVIPLPPGGVELEPHSGSVALAARRYATEEFPVKLGKLEPGHPVRLAIPADLSQQPWQLSLAGHGRVSVCGLGGAT